MPFVRFADVSVNRELTLHTVEMVAEKKATQDKIHTESANKYTQTQTSNIKVQLT